MSSFLSTLVGSKEEEEKEEVEYNIICQKHKLLLQTLTKGNGWRVQHLYNYKGFWLNPNTVKNNLLLHTYFKSLPTDIVLAAFMKSGTTWLKALMFSTLNRHRYNFSDHHLHNHGPQSTFPFLDCESYPITDFTNIPISPRLFATHYSYTLLPACIKSGKIVYVCRDPKDVLISKWHFMSKLRSKDLPPLSLDVAFELFCQGESEYGPFWEHILSYWRASLESPEKILFLKYEEMKKQPEVVVRKLAAFMGKPFAEEEEEKGVVGDIVKLCSFENLSNLEVNNKGVEKFGSLVEVEKRDFFRKGEIGDWKNYLNEEMKERIDRITDDKFKGSGLSLNATV
ncbi:putative Sulfotransferase domain, P-loop containing nucleoside triphosphate hydrolase [Helianthus annuus]|uniref:Sulfotransferase n=1 Tax=Helianthus annuus TaxID=4232 RepID=A0A251VPD0_HELAN|nr:cytosolic sulfotransferase 12 [Helianthus annuus]KAF5822383.1 putative Sulfotransferase domain, P-loop containing nucleoside triphosphate hydrolase [Helianthus annuus]KAJ0627223.1 putative Sulfotransferase domain, P-loop containing nucleoside triphosphate hydrolase [Helianthus annuus]KAJ0783536.1 putative Sulfotransferase domain, P-loop containing nucleoside triphosphate hydrolase [Helianthus annuus]KAJ0948354.1 putative Sulfotransferase domain, P-loop containing nucleoside triphosphate hydr